MASKEPTRHQLSSRLAYKAQTPSFLLKLQNQVSGRSTEENEDNPQYVDGVDEFGRERRPTDLERSGDDPRKSEDEDEDDEKPMVVVLKEGKHLTEGEAVNERRKAKGLPPLPEKSGDLTSSLPPAGSANAASASLKTSDQSGLSFTSKKSGTSSVKRKAPREAEETESKRNQKKPKKNKKGTLSFDQDDLG